MESLPNQFITNFLQKRFTIKPLGFVKGLRLIPAPLPLARGSLLADLQKDRFIVKDAITKDYVWWWDINIPFSPNDFDHLYDKVTAYLSNN